MLKTLQLGVVALSACTFARAQDAGKPWVVLGDIGTVVGVADLEFGLHSFRGIPYARPPLGQLRWREPAPLIPDPSRIIQATNWGPACIQVPFGQPLFPASYETSEDCLFMNVFQPAGLKATAKLPVLVWIYGGGFVEGASQLNDPTLLVSKSIQMGEPIIYASMNYRLNSYGFLASDELAVAQKDGTGTLNAGLHDIQSALLWIQKYVDKFGGDPTKVTVFGESAGAFAIGSLLVADGGKAVQSLKLFRGAIMESGVPSGLTVPPPSYSEGHYRDIASLVGCGPALSNGTSLQCLRGVSSETLTNASINILLASQNNPYHRVQDGYFHDALPSVQVREGRMATVPLVMGTNLDEGTLFASQTLNSDSDLVGYIINIYGANASPTFNATIIPELLRLYPDDPTIGSPYNPVNTSKSDRFYGLTNQYKRAASLLGDAVFNAGRRLLLKAYIEKDDCYPVYNYLFTQNTAGLPPAYLPPAYGVWHYSETFLVYGLYAALFPNNTVGAVSNYMSSAWIAFANNLQPNRPNLPKWPKYGQKGTTLRIGTDAPDYSFTRVITDDFRDEPIAFLESEEWSKEVNF